MEGILDELWKVRHEKDVLFLSIIEGYEIKSFDVYYGDIFYMKNDKIIIRYDSVAEIAYINEDLICSVFQYKYNLNYEEVTEMMIDMINSHLNLKIIKVFVINIVWVSSLEGHIKELTSNIIQ